MIGKRCSQGGELQYYEATRPYQFIPCIPWAPVDGEKRLVVTLFLWILVIFLGVVGLTVVVSPPSPDAPRGLPRAYSRRYDD